MSRRLPDLAHAAWLAPAAAGECKLAALCFARGPCTRGGGLCSRPLPTARDGLDDPETKHSVGDAKRVAEVGQYVGRSCQFEQMEFGIVVPVDPIGEAPGSPCTLVDNRAPTPLDRRLEIGEDPGARLLLCVG